MKKLVLLTALKLLYKCVRGFQSSLHQHFIPLKLNLKGLLVWFFFLDSAAKCVVYVLWPGKKPHSVTRISVYYKFILSLNFVRNILN